MRFVFCGFDFFQDCLKQCLAQGHQLVAAFSQPVDGFYNTNDSIRAICAAQGVELQVRKINSTDVNVIAKNGCNYLVSAAYAYRIPAGDLDRFSIKGLNIHPSLLPEGRGPWPLPHVILRQCQCSGVTIHRLRGEFDCGEILANSEFEVMPNENLETLSCKSQMAAARLLGNVVENLDVFWKNAFPQTGGTYWEMPGERERVLDWNRSVKDIDRIIRAFGKFESWANFDGRDWLVQDATVWREPHNFRVGEVVHKTNREVVISASDGFVCLRQYKPEPEKL